MKKLLISLFFGLLLCASAAAQCNLRLDNESIEIAVPLNSTVTIHWDQPGDSTGLLYFRLRRASAISGTYTVLKTIPWDQRETSFTWTGGDYQYFLTAWFSVNVNGVSTVKESVGSNHVRIKTKKP